MKERILILAKTYPNISEKYGELTCTAGLKENGEWVRIYPIPFRYLQPKSQYKKYEILHVELDKRPRGKDSREESYTIRNTTGSPMEEIELEFDGALDTSNAWEKRRNWVLKSRIFKSKKRLLDEFDDSGRKFSLVTFKPKRSNSSNRARQRMT